MTEILQASLIPFIGTAAGSACVFFLRGELNEALKKGLSAFAGGIMTAASVWSLLIPAVEQSSVLGGFAFLPAALGFMTGVLALIGIDRLIAFIRLKCGGKKEKNSMMALAVVIHNIPEGMAAGAVYAAVLAGSSDVTLSAALALVTGISIQNFPEGAIISMPMRACGASCQKAFGCGVLSGAAEAAGALLTIAAASFIVPVLPVLLSFAAGVMIYVVVKELIPEISGGKHHDFFIAVFAVGFMVMMSLDTALG